MFNGPLIEAGKSCQFIVVLSVLNFICVTAQGQSIYVSEGGGIIAACAGSPSEDPFLYRFTFSATGLNAPVLVGAPVGFEVSLSRAAGYANLVSVSAQTGTIVSTPIFVRASSSPTSGMFHWRLIGSVLSIRSQEKLSHRSR